MTFDALTLAAVRDELAAAILGGQVQRVALHGELTLSLEVYAQRSRRVLVCSAEPEAARVCLADERLPREGETPTPFLLLLRKYVREGRIARIEQPAYERVLRLTITKRDEEGIHGQVALIIEAMGRRSNAVLVDRDGLILDALRRVGPTRNPRRPVLPRRPYADPPPQARLDPLDSASYAALPSEARPGEALAELLTRRLAGFSPLAAREVAYRMTGSADSAAGEAGWARLRETVEDFLSPLQTHHWRPCLALREGRVVAFAPYRLTHLADVRIEEVASISRAVERGLTDAGAARTALPANRALVVAIDGLIGQAERKRAALARELEGAEQAERLRRAGEAVLANLTLIESEQAMLEFGGESIPLDPSLSPLENAQRLFREYRKARDAAKAVPERLGAAEHRLQQLEELRVLAEVADSPARQRAVREELDELRGARPAKAAGAGSTRTEGSVIRGRTPEGLEVLVGTTGRGNEAVTFKLARPDDLWLHARGVPGAHVILRTGGADPPPASLRYAAELAARNSRARSAGKVEVDYTPRKHVRKIPSGPPGLVTYSGERTLAVQPSA